MDFLAGKKEVTIFILPGPRLLTALLYVRDVLQKDYKNKLTEL
jgi:hypothetical protein